ncbi:DNA polymerase III subunit delta [Lapidilactobacillus luobeiensis]|uniref:DNA polymerase III subunit delta n=1 Tax=Lapidilactobacillus luobeiensis TaxID=2950371 RepID=UPI0021C48C6F|nr:DNA polymerase III subunit delta [Lapidilactobacillus luobeiensis]
MVKTATKIISLEQLQQTSLTELPPVIVVLGQEQALLTQIQTYFDRLLTPDERQMNLGRYDLQETSLAVALDDAASVPFFGDWRLVILTTPFFLTGATNKNKVEQDPALLLGYLQQPQPTTKLVIWADYEKLDERKKVTKQLKKVALFVNAGKVQGTELNRRLQRDCQRLGATITAPALNLLLQRTRDDYSAALQQMEKLALYVGPTGAITPEIVARTVEQVIDDNAFELVAATLNGHLQSALLIYRKLIINGQEPIGLLALLLTQVRLLLQVKIMQQAGYTQGTIAQQLSVHPYRIKLALGQARNYRSARLQEMYLRLVKLDYQIKTGQVDKTNGLELLITRFATQ